VRRLANLTLPLLAVAFVVLGTSRAAVAAPAEPVGVEQADARTGRAERNAEEGAADETAITVGVPGDDASLSRTVIIILLLTVGALAPGILLLMTSFTRFVVVLALTRNGLGLQGIPPTQVLIGLALFMTFFVMGPVLGQVNERAIQPALAGRIDTSEAFSRGFEPLRTFMLERTDPSDLETFTGEADVVAGAPQEVPARVLIPAFAISELRKAFLIGFVIFVPFLVIDLVVSAVLMGLGMVMVPPIVISLPLKLLLFVLVDGWDLIVRSLMASAGGG
jgi:flagellar biosynthetic protein FliP